MVAGNSVANRSWNFKSIAFPSLLGDYSWPNVVWPTAAFFLTVCILGGLQILSIIFGLFRSQSAPRITWLQGVQFVTINSAAGVFPFTVIFSFTFPISRIKAPVIDLAPPCIGSVRVLWGSQDSLIKEMSGPVSSNISPGYPQFPPGTY